jgi:hypothetical protein
VDPVQRVPHSIMDEYLAHTATGGLRALLRDDLDRELLDAAGEILTALVNFGPPRTSTTTMTRPPQATRTPA